MNQSPQVTVSQQVIRPLLSRLMNASSQEAAQIGARLQAFVTQGEPIEAVTVFAYESWGAVESVLRIGETQFGIKDYAQLPDQMQTLVATIATIWGLAFKKHPAPMSRAFVALFERADATERRRLTWFTIPISKHIGRSNLMEYAAEQIRKFK